MALATMERAGLLSPLGRLFESASQREAVRRVSVAKKSPNSLIGAGILIPELEAWEIKQSLLDQAVNLSPILGGTSVVTLAMGETPIAVVRTREGGNIYITDHLKSRGETAAAITSKVDALLDPRAWAVSALTADKSPFVALGAVIMTAYDSMVKAGTKLSLRQAQATSLTETHPNAVKTIQGTLAVLLAAGPAVVQTAAEGKPQKVDITSRQGIAATGVLGTIGAAITTAARALRGGEGTNMGDLRPYDPTDPAMEPDRSTPTVGVTATEVTTVQPEIARFPWSRGEHPGEEWWKNIAVDVELCGKIVTVSTIDLNRGDKKGLNALAQAELDRQTNGIFIYSAETCQSFPAMGEQFYSNSVTAAKLITPEQLNGPTKEAAALIAVRDAVMDHAKEAGLISGDNPDVSLVMIEVTVPAKDNPDRTGLLPILYDKASGKAHLMLGLDEAGGVIPIGWEKGYFFWEMKFQEQPTGEFMMGLKVPENVVAGGMTPLLTDTGSELTFLWPFRRNPNEDLRFFPLLQLTGGKKVLASLLGIDGPEATVTPTPEPTKTALPPTPEPTATPEPTKDYSSAGPFIDLPISAANKRYFENIDSVEGAEIGNGSILGVTVIDYIPTGEETADVLFGFSYNGLTYKFWMTTASCRDPLPKLEKGKTYNITGSFFTQVTDRESLAKLIERNGGNTQGKGCQTFINLQPISPDEMSKYFRGGDPTWGGKIKDLRGKFYLGNNAEENGGLYINGTAYPAPPTPTPTPTSTP